jgi:hypothetical protein
MRTLQLSILCAALALLSPGQATSQGVPCAQSGIRLGLLGLDQPDGTVFAQVTNSDGGCGCTEFRFRPQQTNTQIALSLLVTAKSAGALVRIDARAPGMCDTAFRVYLQ